MMLHDYKGAFHIHSTYSDGSSNVREIAEAAGRAGLHFLVLTDHDTLEAREDGWEGWHNDILIVVGAEFSPPSDGHCIAMGISEITEVDELSASDCLKHVAKQGGSAYIVHPLGQRKRMFRINLTNWKEWDNELYHGIEIWSYMHDWIKELNVWRFRDHYQRPASKITGPEPEIMRRWDEVCQRRRVVAIGGLDAHSRRIPFAGIHVFPYEDLFRTLRTHVLCEKLSGNADKDIRTITREVDAGHCYISYDLLADATGFNFLLDGGDCLAIMGDEIPFEQGKRLTVKSPVEAEMRLLRNGQLIADVLGQDISFDVTEPGVYRIEAFLQEKPWVFTNPIYVRP